MKITNNQVFSAQNYLSQLDLSKFEKEVRIAIYKNVGELNAVIKSVQEKMKDSRTELFKGMDVESVKVSELRNEYNAKDTTPDRKHDILLALNDYAEYFAKEREFIEITNSYGNDEVELPLCEIDFDNFVEGLIESGKEFTATQLQTLSFIFKFK